jgi:hypothetical protein
MRPAWKPGKDEQRRGCVADQDVLEHVRREQVLLARPVERRDERERRKREASEEEQGSRRSHVVFAAASSQADERLPEERDREAVREEDERGGLPIPGEMRKRDGDACHTAEYDARERTCIRR